MFDGNFRTSFDQALTPVGKTIHRAGISPDAVTALGVVMSLACGAAVGFGQFLPAVVLLALTGIPDALDGSVARAAGRSGPRGAFLDSVADRLSDGLILGGAAWFYANGEEPQLALLPFGIYLAASLVSYQRAKAEQFGFDAKGGLMERAERLITFGAALVFAPWFTPILVIMFVATVYTVLYRFVKVWRQASVVGDPPPHRRRRRRKARPVVESFRERARERASARRRRRT